MDVYDIQCAQRVTQRVNVSGTELKEVQFHVCSSLI